MKKQVITYFKASNDEKVSMFSPTKDGSNTNNYKPIGPRVLVEVLSEGEDKQGRFYIPEQAQEPKAHGRVLALGTLPNKNNTKQLPIPFKVGDIVVYPTNCGIPTRDKQKLVLVEDIFAVIEEN